MKKAGGIIGLVAGIFGVIAAVATLFFGGLAGAMEAEGAGTVVGLGWGGLAFSFLVIVLGAVAMGARSMVPGILLIVCSLAGAVLGGSIVAIAMVLALAGGVLVILGVRSEAKATVKSV